MIDTLLLLALNGLIWGLIIALIALGLSVIFGLLDIINIAHGDFFMVGTVLASFSYCRRPAISGSVFSSCRWSASFSVR